jgi:hypothetical protein
MPVSGAEGAAPEAGSRSPRTWAWVAVVILGAALVMVPPVVYQTYHCFLGWHDVGNYARANYSFFDFGRFATSGDGADDFFAQQHFEPFFFLLCVPVRLLGTPGYVAAITLALVLAAGYVFALGAEVSRSRLAGALCAAAFVANPYTYAIALSYHVETFGMLFLFAFAYHARANHTARAWIALGLALTVKEDMWVYAAVTAILVGRRERVTHTAGHLAAAAGYYFVVVQWIGGTWYPEANYFNSFYLSGGQPLGKLQIAGLLLGRWREFAPLLFTGPGLLFQASLLFLGTLAGWRYLLACAVMLLWLTYPDGPPRSNFSYYYSYAALTVSFVILPFALANLRAACGRLVPRVEPRRCGAWATWLAMGAMLGGNLAMHLPGYGPEPIRGLIDPRAVWGRGPGVSVPVVRSLIALHLPADAGSVLSQFYTYCAVPQRREMYVTLWDRGEFLSGRLKPTFVLLDLNAKDPWVSPGELQAMAALLRRGDAYQPVYDARGVMLYRRIGIASR